MHLNELKRKSEAVQIMGICTCELGNAEEAQTLVRYMQKGHRQAIIDACSGKGITLTLE